MAVERTFRVMGSDAHVVVVGGADGLVDRAQERVGQLEALWSRFLDTSEISEINRHAGQFVSVSPETLALVARSVDAWRISAGAFDPTLLGAVIRAGYDRSFEQLGSAPPNGVSALGAGVDDIEISDGAVRLPPGTGFDPGGIGKGLAADMVCSELIALGAHGACINLGGDVRVEGCGPDGTTWTVGVEHPWSATPIALLGVADGAVATSTTLRRAWRTDGEARHHLIDPHTGLSSVTDLVLVAVVAAEAATAEVLAKAVLLAGAAHPFDILGGTGVEGLAADRSGRLQATDGLVAYLGDARLPARVVPPA